MDTGETVGSSPGMPRPVGRYTVYAAGGMFNQHELVTNVLIKEAVWRLSGGKFELFLPQSVEARELDAAYLRNVCLLDAVKADIVLARFDGLELDSGTVVEFAMAKSLGKPVVILRSDYRGSLQGMELPPDQGIDQPYNAMVKSWPRTVEVHTESMMDYVGLLAKEHEALDDSVAFQATMKAELNTVQKGVDAIAKRIIDGLEEVLGIKSPYPPEYQEIVYQALRYSPGNGFDQLLTEDALGEIIQRLARNGTL